MFTKIYNFFDDYSCLFLILLGLFIFIIGIAWYTSWITKIRYRNIDIITKTKDYTIFNSCRQFDSKFYCWED